MQSPNIIQATKTKRYKTTQKNTIILFVSINSHTVFTQSGKGVNRDSIGGYFRLVWGINRSEAVDISGFKFCKPDVQKLSTFSNCFPVVNGVEKPVLICLRLKGRESLFDGLGLFQFISAQFEKNREHVFCSFSLRFFFVVVFLFKVA